MLFYGLLLSDLISRQQLVRFQAFYTQGRLFQRNHRVGVDAVHQHYAGAYYRVMAYHGVAAQDRGVRVDDNIVFQGRMTLHAADDVSLRVARETEGSERHALIQ